MLHVIKPLPGINSWCGQLYIFKLDFQTQVLCESYRVSEMSKERQVELLRVEKNTAILFACSIIIKKNIKNTEQNLPFYITRTNKINKVVLIVQNEHSDLHKDMHVLYKNIYITKRVPFYTSGTGTSASHDSLRPGLIQISQRQRESLRITILEKFLCWVSQA